MAHLLLANEHGDYDTLEGVEDDIELHVRQVTPATRGPGNDRTRLARAQRARCCAPVTARRHTKQEYKMPEASVSPRRASATWPARCVKRPRPRGATSLDDRGRRNGEHWFDLATAGVN
jgi:hypothetical protein